MLVRFSLPFDDTLFVHACIPTLLSPLGYCVVSVFNCATLTEPRFA
jgi:hypothetical protein